MNYVYVVVLCFSVYCLFGFLPGVQVKLGCQLDSNGFGFVTGQRGHDNGYCAVIIV